MKLHTYIPAMVISAVLSVTVGCAGNTRHDDTTRHDGDSKHQSAGEYIDDAMITTKVKAAIVKEESLRASEVNVETFDGVVQLSGFVSSEGDIQRAVQLAREVKGVKSVKNDMRLKAN